MSHRSLILTTACLLVVSVGCGGASPASRRAALYNGPRTYSCFSKLPAVRRGRAYRPKHGYAMRLSPLRRGAFASAEGWHFGVGFDHYPYVYKVGGGTLSYVNLDIYKTTAVAARQYRKLVAGVRGSPIFGDYHIALDENIVSGWEGNPIPRDVFAAEARIMRSCFRP